MSQRLQHRLIGLAAVLVAVLLQGCDATATFIYFNRTTVPVEVVARGQEVLVPPCGVGALRVNVEGANTPLTGPLPADTYVLPELGIVQAPDNLHGGTVFILSRGLDEGSVPGLESAPCEGVPPPTSGQVLATALQAAHLPSVREVDYRPATAAVSGHTDVYLVSGTTRAQADALICTVINQAAKESYGYQDRYGYYHPGPAHSVQTPDTEVDVWDSAGSQPAEYVDCGATGSFTPGP